MQRKYAIFIFKLLSTVALTALLISPTFKAGGILPFPLSPESTVVMIGFVIAFLIGVAFYCRSLQKCLLLIRPENRTMQPKSVWLMFVLPYNFIEDFFIIHGVTCSLKAEAKTNPRLKQVTDFGKITGLGWCIAQIISLIPTAIGLVAAVIALALWAVHWRTIVTLTRLLGPSASISVY